MKPADRRFIQYWEDQRQGSKSGFYLTYILGWGVVTFFVIFFVTRLFTNLWETGGPYLALVFILIGLVVAFAVTHLTWTKNEQRLSRLKEEYKDELN